MANETLNKRDRAPCRECSRTVIMGRANRHHVAEAGVLSPLCDSCAGVDKHAATMFRRRLARGWRP